MTAATGEVKADGAKVPLPNTFAIGTRVQRGNTPPFDAELSRGSLTAMNRPQHLVLYDSECPLCTFQMKLITWMDWFNHVRLLPINDPRSQEMNHGLSREDLMEAIHCITPEGRIYRGARALRFLGMRLPLFVPAALFLWIPGVIWIAERVYIWVSRNRQILSRIFGCKGACAILPERRRD